ncbi:MAG TPA: flavoprotein, partial [Desulfobaccales bacterium]|nr:flavoprotein [Desulfobaccales bacterium]
MGGPKAHEELLRNFQGKATMPFNGKRILLGVTGGIAAYKAAEVARRFIGCGARVKVVMTRSAQEFVGPLTFAALTGEK